MHQKLASPSKRDLRTPEEQQRDLAEQQRQAEERRAVLLRERTERLKQSGARIAAATEKHESEKAQLAVAIHQQQAKAGRKRREFLAGIQARAKEELGKTARVQSAASDTSAHRAQLLLEKLRETDARKLERDEERRRDSEAALAKVRAAAEKRALEDARRQRKREADLEKKRQAEEEWEAQRRRLTEEKEAQRRERQRRVDEILAGKQAEEEERAKELLRECEEKMTESEKRKAEQIELIKARASARIEHVKEAAASADDRWRHCVVCQVDLLTEADLQTHLKARSHEQALLAADHLEEKLYQRDGIMDVRANSPNRRTPSPSRPSSATPVNRNDQAASPFPSESNASSDVPQPSQLAVPATLPSESHPPTEARKAKSNKQRFKSRKERQKLVNVLSHQFQSTSASHTAQNMDAVTAKLTSLIPEIQGQTYDNFEAVEHMFSELARILRKGSPHDTEHLYSSGGLATVLRVCMLADDASRPLVHVKTLLAALQVIKILTALPADRAYLLANGYVAQVVDLLNRLLLRCSGLAPDPLNAAVNAIDVIVAVLDGAEEDSRHSRNDLSRYAPSLLSRCPDHVRSRSIVESGTFENVRGALFRLNDVPHDDPLSRRFYSRCMALFELVSAQAECMYVFRSPSQLTNHSYKTTPVYDYGDANIDILQAFKATDLAGIVTVLGSLLLYPGTPKNVTTLPKETLVTSVSAIKTLNHLAYLHLPTLQTCLATDGMQNQFFHLLRFCLTYCTSHVDEHATAVLDEILLLVGHFVLLHPGNQNMPSPGYPAAARAAPFSILFRSSVSMPFHDWCSLLEVPSRNYFRRSLRRALRMMTIWAS